MQLAAIGCHSLLFTAIGRALVPQICPSSNGVKRGAEAITSMRARRLVDGPEPSGYDAGMTAAAVTGSGAAPVPPDADPVAIRACLTPRMVAEFDAEWNIVLDQAKQSKDLAGVRDLLAKWRHFAYAEMRDPGTYFRLLAKAEQIQRTGRNPDAVPLEDMKALIEQRRRGQ
jgi:hypothetical protein